jgi:hypothetical protein
MAEQSQQRGSSAYERALSCDPDKHLPQLLDQYKLFVEMADRLSARRILVNNSYITMVGAGAFAYSAAPQYFKGFERFFQLGITFGCVILAVMWYATIAYYRELSGAKFHVINEMETLLPAQPFAQEWKYLSEQKSSRGRTSFITQTWIEMRVPLFVAVVSLCGFLYTLYDLVWPRLP